MQIGNTVGFIYKSDLVKDYSPFINFIDDQDGHGYFRIRLDKGNLVINSEVYEFDGKLIGKITNNVLHVANPNYELHAADDFIELYDEFNIPVLQIKLDKRTNSIYFGGAINSPVGWVVITPDSVVMCAPSEHKLLLDTHSRDSMQDSYLTDARKVKPLNQIYNRLGQNRIYKDGPVPETGPNDFARIELIPGPIIKRKYLKDTSVLTIGLTCTKGFSANVLVKVVFSRRGDTSYYLNFTPFEQLTKNGFLNSERSPMFLHYHVSSRLNKFFMTVTVSFSNEQETRMYKFHRVYVFINDYNRPLKEASIIDYNDVYLFLFSQNQW